MFKNLSPRLKIKIRLADSLDLLAEDAVTIDARYDFEERAAALRAEVEAEITEMIR
jgi:hypothetical protein